ncbi:MAG: tail fiber domain-containing protein, partial [bacterium]
GSSTATNFIVTNNGNVGIGMSNPSYPLDVIGKINISAPTTLVTSYSNPGGSGNRTPSITVTYSAGSTYNSSVVDSDTSTSGWLPDNSSAWLTFNFGSQVIINETTFYTQNMGAWFFTARWQASNDGVTFSNITGSTFNLPGTGSPLTDTTLSANTTAYQYYRLQVTALSAAWPYLNEINFKLAPSGANYPLLTVGGLATINGNQVITGNLTGTSALFSGNMSIGTTSTASRLTVQGASGISALTIASSSGASLFTVAANGSVGIGTTTPWRTLSVQGNVSISGLTTAITGDSALCLSANNEVTVNNGVTSCAVSSIRYKYDVATSTVGLDLVRAMRPVTFKYNGQSNEHVGFIAEEVDLLEPRLVARSSDGQIQSVRYEEFTSVLAKAIQEIDTKVTDIDSRLMHLESLMATSTTQTVGGGFSFSQILAGFENLGAKFVNGIAYLKNVFVDSLTVGSKAKPSGITLYDEVTGDAYCMKMRNGAMVSIPGECSSVQVSTTTPSAIASTTPVITILGNNPAEITLGSSYVDLGATVTAVNPDGTVNNNLGLHFTVDGLPVTDIAIDTATTSVHTIVYSATSGEGVTGYATRTVSVISLTDILLGTGGATTTSPVTTATTTQALGTTTPITI